MVEREATIRRAWALEFRPYKRVDGRPRARCAVIRIEASPRERRGSRLGFIRPSDTPPTVVGFGEIANLSESAANRDARWRFTEIVTSHLEGRAVTVPDNLADDALLTTLRQLRQLATEAVADCPAAQGEAVLAGVEMALLDVTAKVAGVPFSGALGGGPRRAVQVSSGEAISAASAESEMRTAAHAQAPFPMLRFGDISDAVSAVRAIDMAGDVAGVGKPVWLDLGVDLAHDEHKIIDSVAEAVRARSHPAHVVLRVPSEGNEGVWGELQKYADILVPPQDRPGIVIMPASRNRSQRALLALAGSGVRGLEIDPAQSGGLIAARKLVRDVAGSFPEVRIGLNVPPRSGRVAARAVVGLAEALPGLDYFSLCPAQLSDTVSMRPALEMDERGQVRPWAEPGLGMVVLAAAARRLARCSNNVAESVPKAEGAAVNVYQEMLIAGTHLISHLMERAALGLGLDTLRSRQTVVCTHPMLKESIGFASSMTGYAGRASSWVLLFKDLTRKIMKDAGVPVADGMAFAAGQTDEAVDFANDLGGSAVVKPRRGAGGVNVFTDLRTDAEVRRAIEELPDGLDFLVEKYVTGELYRFLVVGNRVVSVVLCRPTTVVGDGRSTIVELALAKNALKLNNPHMSAGLLGFGTDTINWLNRQALSADSVPEVGRVIRLRGAVNGAQGADTIEVLDETHPSMLDLAVRATRAVPGLDHTGIDLIGDHRRTADQQELAVLELNMPPGLGLHHYPMAGPVRDVSTDLVRRSCELAGFDPGDVRPSLNLRVRIRGKVHDVGYRSWFSQHAKSRGVSGSIGPAADGELEALVDGDLVNVAILVSGAWIGPPEASVVSVEAHHLDPAPEVRAGFEVLK